MKAHAFFISLGSLFFGLAMEFAFAEPASSHPNPRSGFAEYWFSESMGEGVGVTSKYAVRFIGEPPLRYEGAEPVGVVFDNISTAVGRAKDQPQTLKPTSPRRCCFEGLIWVLRDQFGYSAGAVIGPDGSLVGFCTRVWNNSKTNPLILVRQPGTPLFVIEISVEGVKLNTFGKKRIAEGGQKDHEWKLQGRESAEIFSPLQDFLPKDFDPKQGKMCQFNLTINVFPKDMTRSFEPALPSPVFPFKAWITKDGLAMDPRQAFKQAAEDVFESRKNK